MNRKHWSYKLAALNPCHTAIAWAREKPSEATAWKTCRRGDWMLWLVGKLDTSAPYSDERRTIVATACACANLSREYMPQASRDALGVISRWAAGETTIDRARLDAVVSAAEAAYSACSAARSAADAAYSQCADIVRQHYPRPPRLP